MKIGLAILAAVTATVSNAGAALAADQFDCSDRAREMVELAYPDVKIAADRTFVVDGADGKLAALGQDDGDPHDVICRIWPQFPSYTLVAVPLIGKQSADGNEGALDLIVVAGDAEIAGRLHLSDYMSDDAVAITRIAFDTARYEVTPSLTAFGLRKSETGSSRVNPFSQTSLSLFVVDKTGLRPVLDSLVVERAGGEWDGNCAGHFYEESRTLGMLPGRTNGSADIAIDGVSSFDRNVDNTDGCDSETIVEETAKAVLKFDGKQYAVPSSWQDWNPIMADPK